MFKILTCNEISLTKDELDALILESSKDSYENGYRNGYRDGLNDGWEVCPGCDCDAKAVNSFFDDLYAKYCESNDFDCRTQRYDLDDAE